MCAMGCGGPPCVKPVISLEKERELTLAQGDLLAMFGAGALWFYHELQL